MNQIYHRRQSIEWSGRLVHWSQITTDSDRPDLVYINSFVADQDAGETQTNEPAKHIQLYGFRSKPPVGCEVISLVCSGGSSQKVVVASDNAKLGPTDLNPGETAIYTKSGSVVKFDKDGNISITAAAGKDVTVNGGTLNVARKTDKVIADSGMITWMSSVAGYINGIVPGTVTPPAPPNFGVINGGADHFKG
jgi:hypothetical protein